MKIICLDGFKPEYLKDAPFLNKLSKGHLHGELETVFSFTGISASFFTGDYPNKHGVFVMFELSKKCFVLKINNKFLTLYKNLLRFMKGKKFFYSYYNIPHHALKYSKPALDKMWYQKNVLEEKTLFDYLDENNITYSYLDFPHFVDKGKEKIFFSHSDKAVLSKMKKLKSKVQFIFLHELDSLSHKYGPGSKEVKRHVKFLDRELSKLKENIIIWSDHGFLKVKGYVDILSKLECLDLKYGKDYVYFLDSSMARFWFKNKEALKKVEKELKKIKNGKILSEKEFKELNVPIKQDLLFLCDPGYIVSPNFFDGKNIPKGMHGYDPRLKEQKGFYLLSFVKGKKKYARLIDLMPTVLKILKINKTSEVDGKSLI